MQVFAARLWNPTVNQMVNHAWKNCWYMLRNGGFRSFDTKSSTQIILHEMTWNDGYWLWDDLKTCGEQGTMAKRDSWSQVTQGVKDCFCSAWPLSTLSRLFGVLCFWQRIRSLFPGHQMVFLDKLCINQMDSEKKQQGILGLGAFVLRSKKLLVLWSPRYFTRMWCHSALKGTGWPLWLVSDRLEKLLTRTKLFSGSPAGVEAGNPWITAKIPL